MSHVLPPRSYRQAAACAAALLALLLLCPAPARAEPTRSRDRSSPSSASQFEKDLKVAEDHDPQSRNAIRLFKGWFALFVLALVVAPVVIAVTLVLRFVSRMTATTSPDKLAESDPWVRAELARRKAGGEQPPPAGEPGA